MSKKSEAIIKKANESNIYNKYFTVDPQNDKKKGFVSMTHAFIFDKHFLELTSNAKLLYMYMKDTYRGTNNFKYPQSFANNINMAPATFKRAKKELIDKGFIEIVEWGYSTRTENIYSFSEKWKCM